MDAVPIPRPPLSRTTNGVFGIAPGYGCAPMANGLCKAGDDVASSLSATSQLKPKQSKSRNGCSTCKAKRLKCDETKPTCHQCEKRGVQCAGYKRDYKWKPCFEDGVGGKQPKRGSGSSRSRRSSPPQKVPPIPQEPLAAFMRSMEPGGMSPTGLPSPTQHFSGHQTPMTPPPIINEVIDSIEQVFGMTLSELSAQPPSPPLSDHFPRSLRCDEEFQAHTPPEIPTELSFIDASDFPELLGSAAEREPDQCPSTPLLGDSFGFLEKSPIRENFDMQETNIDTTAEDIEEIIRADWPLPPLSPTRTTLGCSPPLAAITVGCPSPVSIPRRQSFVSAYDVFRRPSVKQQSDEILLGHFDQYTCGIMSVKDGKDENPWRTLVWPLARESPALYHAISAMTAFHMSRTRLEMQFEGQRHFQTSTRFLLEGISNSSINSEAALATTLVLAFSESFDLHITTGTTHRGGARGMLQAMMSNSKKLSENRYRFLFNVWVYLDVLARLTCNPENIDYSEANDPIFSVPFAQTTEVDPLLGCAGSLFPIIGKVATLAQRVRRLRSASIVPEMHSEAANLNAQLENWQASQFYEPNDPKSSLSHCLATAEAYRWATLLYLHQAIPELAMPARTAYGMATRVLKLLSSVHPSSRATIVHIYPLLAAGCEAIGTSMRKWVENRWESMRNNMQIGNVEKAWQVTTEVWRRRDAWLERQRRARQEELFSSERRGSADLQWEQDMATVSIPLEIQQELAELAASLPNTDFPSSQGRRASIQQQEEDLIAEYRYGEMGRDVTVRGKMHWIGVMQDWDWEVLLG